MKSVKVLLGHILECIKYIEEFTKDMSFEEFEIRVDRQDAVQRRLEIIGEAVKHLPKDLLEKYPDIPWRQVASMRDLLIHEYFNVSISQVWEVAERELPPLKATIQKMINDKENQTPS